MKPGRVTRQLAPFRTTLSQMFKQDWRIPAVLFLLIATVNGTVLWGSERIGREVTANVESSLTTVLTTIHEALVIWAEDRKNDAVLLAQSPETGYALKHDLADLPRIREAISPALRSYGAVDFAVADRTGAILAMGGRDRELQQAAQTPDFLQRTIRGEPSFAFVQTDSSPTILVSAPIHDGAGPIIGAFILKLDPTKELESILKLGRLRQTGETYIFDKGGRVLTESRFSENTVVATAKHLVSDEVSRSVTGANLNGYPDYRGVQVVGAWHWDEDLGVGIVTEIDSDEAFAPIRGMRRLALFMSVVITAVLLAILAVLANRARLAAANLAYQHELKARQNVLAIVSHDLKNPINTILLACALPEVEMRQSGTAIVRRAAQTMLRLITDLLDTSRIEAGQLQMDMQPCSPEPLIKESLETISALAERKQIQITSHISHDVSMFRADPKRIVQVLSNLLGNAVKFTPVGGKIDILVKRRDSSHVEFVVSDTGDGIPVDDQPYIFDQYWQPSKSRGQGSGLGLYICKSIIAASGGDIEVRSSPGHGAAFVFTLPIAAGKAFGRDIQ